jgi:hypothetical protein
VTVTLILHFRPWKPRPVTVSSFVEAGQAMRQVIEANNYGASDMGQHNGLLLDIAGNRVGTVNYNGTYRRLY